VPETKTESGVASHKKSGDEKDKVDDDPASSRTDTSENSVTLVTDSVTDQPTLTNS
jgi:hypothetical protein